MVLGAETVVRWCSVKKVFLEISQNSQENTRARVSFALDCNFIKKETLGHVFPCEFCEISKNTCFYRTPPVAAYEVSNGLSGLGILLANLGVKFSKNSLNSFAICLFFFVTFIFNYFFVSIDFS